ncbi:hypothetical protein HEP84_20210 [Streptomyces sp. RLB1-33]|nr:hypothetical protein [Streptomyces sp. RLB1-33]QIY71153.1 hypothetical protein HEP84_20210 [Streptomyces sp. RLB1-33]
MSATHSPIAAIEVAGSAGGLLTSRLLKDPGLTTASPQAPLSRAQEDRVTAQDPDDDVDKGRHHSVGRRRGGQLGVAGVPGVAAVGGVTGSATVTLAIASFTAWLSFATSAAKSWPLSALSAALSRSMTGARMRRGAEYAWMFPSMVRRIVCPP